MRQSQLFGITSRSLPADEVSMNARLLIRAGFIDKLMAGVYSFLPLGWRMIERIAKVIREEMNALGGQEILLPALHPKEPWAESGRWNDPGREVMFQLTGRADREYGLGWTHEEIVTPLAKKIISSYKDLPLAVYQIQTKFRDEPRAKSGLLRGREFIMKDLYSFHADARDLDDFYKKTQVAYQTIFRRLGLEARLTEASGGAFSKYSHEFQVPTPAGEDIIFVCDGCAFCQNREVSPVKNGDPCPQCGKAVRAERAIEVGNIFRLGTRFSEAFNLKYRDKRGADHFVVMGSYGIGLGRLLGAIVEVHHDERGMILPKEAAPFDAHLIALSEGKDIESAAKQCERTLQKAGFDILYDDRDDASAGAKLADADLIGLPIRLIISERTLSEGSVEVKRRSEEKSVLVPLKDIAKYVPTVPRTMV